MRAWLLVIAALAGCVHDNLVDCSNGVVCPSGFVCDLAHDGCVTPDQLTACNGLADLAACLDHGICHEGVCLPGGCGNGRIDPGEVCDDGNVAGADGCSSECTSTEICGNHIIDPVNSEECDDGNLANHDGCDSHCVRETPMWTQPLQVDHPGREAFAYAYDEARQRLVVFGGSDSTPNRLGDTLVWNGPVRTWLDETPALSPTPRYGAAMVYDADRRVLVMFGGNDPGGVVPDTWLWDGAQWRSATTSARPEARQFHQMAYDSKRHRVILFGGRLAGGGSLQTLLNDTWAWDGTNWTQLATATSPPARERASMAYDPVRDEIVLAGGFIFGSAGQNDTWVFDGATWHRGPDLPAGPNMMNTPDGARFAPAMAFDPVDGGLVLAGGAGYASTTAETLIRRNGAWEVLASTSPFANRQHLALYFDRQLGKMVAGLGQVTTGTTTTYSMDMSVLDVGATPTTSTWSALAVELGPVALIDPSLAYDAARGKVVAFGGRVMSSLQNRTFELDDGSWTERMPSTKPRPREHTPMTYDSARRRSVLWGGSVGGIADTNVWEWDGTNWHAMPSGSSAPPIRRDHQLAYDPVSHTTVLFGGLDLGGTTLYGDTWLWNGTVWQNVGGGPAPDPRCDFGMVYDEERHEIVLFGGRNLQTSGMTRYGDTWTWTRAGGWVLRTPITSPAARAHATMAWDPVRRRVLLFGGNIGAANQDDTWEWDGTTWNRLILVTRPGASNSSQLVYDGLDKQLLLLGSSDPMWRLQWRGPGTDDVCDLALDADRDGQAGCADADCGSRCTPLCPPLTTCGSPSCGDGACGPLETCRLCPGDCGACAASCGDTFCDPSETCPGDCP